MNTNRNVMTMKTKTDWFNLTEQVKDRFEKVFGQPGPIVQLIYHDGDYADNFIDIDGIIEIGEVPVNPVVSTIKGPVIQKWWQLFTVSDDVNEHGSPHQTLDNCIREAVKLYAEHSFDAYMEQLYYEKQDLT